MLNLCIHWPNIYDLRIGIVTRKTNNNITKRTIRSFDERTDGRTMNLLPDEEWKRILQSKGQWCKHFALPCIASHCLDSAHRVSFMYSVVQIHMHAPVFVFLLVLVQCAYIGAIGIAASLIIIIGIYSVEMFVLRSAKWNATNDNKDAQLHREKQVRRPELANAQVKNEHFDNPLHCSRT